MGQGSRDRGLYGGLCVWGLCVWRDCTRGRALHMAGALCVCGAATFCDHGKRSKKGRWKNEIGFRLEAELGGRQPRGPVLSIPGGSHGVPFLGLWQGGGPCGPLPGASAPGCSYHVFSLFSNLNTVLCLEAAVDIPIPVRTLGVNLIHREKPTALPGQLPAHLLAQSLVILTDPRRREPPASSAPQVSGR